MVSVDIIRLCLARGICLVTCTTKCEPRTLKRKIHASRDVPGTNPRIRTVTGGGGGRCWDCGGRVGHPCLAAVKLSLN